MSIPAVMLSVNPEWCRLIESGRKTVEIRKTHPKVDGIFKVYIYETKSFWYTPKFFDTSKYKMEAGSGKVIGEFFCNQVIPIKIEYSNPESVIADALFPYTEMTEREIINYLGNGKTGYGWSIAGLKIYDCPKDLQEFRKPCSKPSAKHTDDCGLCKAYDPQYKHCMKTLLSPPLSWCYVENLEEQHNDKF